jgi:hypothetical protein
MNIEMEIHEKIEAHFRDFGKKPTKLVLSELPYIELKGRVNLLMFGDGAFIGNDLVEYCGLVIVRLANPRDHIILVG